MHVLIANGFHLDRGHEATFIHVIHVASVSQIISQSSTDLVTNIYFIHLRLPVGAIVFEIVLAKRTSTHHL